MASHITRFARHPALVSSRGFHLSSALRNDDKNKGNCDSGLCPRYQMDMKQLLSRKEMEQLQPARSKFELNQFTISRPHVDKFVNPEMEENCKRKKMCDEMKKSGGKKQGK